MMTGGLRTADGGGLARIGALLVLLVLAFWPMSVGAHAATPLKEETVQAGPYAIKISYYSLPRAEQAASLTLAPLPGSPVFQQVKATLRPAGATNSTPRTLTVRPDPTDGPGVQEVLVTANVVGPWTLHLEVNGPQGPATVDTMVVVAGPAAIPVWVGWLIGLSPLYLAILFVGWQVVALRRRRALAPMPG
jgi:hypothetical protein